MKADSTFWLAYWRFAYAREWYLNLDDRDIIDAIKAHRAALPERDRLVFESWLTDTIALALSRAREATERFPITGLAGCSTATGCSMPGPSTIIPKRKRKARSSARSH